MPTQVSIHYAFRHSVRITAAATTHVLKLTGLGLGLGSGLGLGLGPGLELGLGIGLLVKVRVWARVIGQG